MTVTRFRLVLTLFAVVVLASMGLFFLRDAISSQAEFTLMPYLPYHQKTSSNRNTSVLCQEDAARVELLAKLSSQWTGVTAKEFFQLVMYPMQSACVDLKRIGGSWWGKGFDGAKYVCLDDLVPGPEPCLIYSFGISNDISFEDAMVKYGCKVYAHDHTISKAMKKQLERPNLSVRLRGIATENSDMMSTLTHLLQENGHLAQSITYLKVDVEGAERDLIPQWIKAGLLDRVKQIRSMSETSDPLKFTKATFEFTAKNVTSTLTSPEIGVEFHDVQGSNVKTYFDIVRDLAARGFKIVSFDPNFVMGTNREGLMTCFEIVFRRVKTPCPFDEKRSKK